MILPDPSFLGRPVAADLRTLDADIVVLGIPHGVAYEVDDEQRGLAEAPAAVRAASQAFAPDLAHHDFDLGRAFLRDGGPRVVDAGDVPFAFGAGADNVRAAEEALAHVVGRGAMPLVIGGDDSIPPIVARALAARGRPFDVVTVDAHLDFRDEVDGERHGRSSPARRMSELPQVRSVTQVGLRGIGGSRPRELEEALAAGHRLITAAELHEHGQRWLCEQLPSGGDVFVSIDCDGLDPSVAPGTGWPQPGGLTFRDVAALIAQLARTGTIVGGDVVELLPARDVNGLTALTATRLLMLLADAAA